MSGADQRGSQFNGVLQPVRITSALRAKETTVQRERHPQPWDIHAQRFIAEHPDLADAMAKADAVSQSTGASSHDYVTLYRAIHKLQARTILECGTGKTTYALAAALKAFGGTVRLVSMDHDEQWHTHAKQCFPFGEFPFVDMHYSPKAVWGFSLFQGTVYSEVPSASYDLVFVDGPSAHIDVQPCPNMDFVRLVSESDRAIPALVDLRKLTLMAYAILFPGKVHFTKGGIGVVEPVSRADLAIPYKQEFPHKRRLLESFPRLLEVQPNDPLDFL
jgi:Methyltransferase domain